MHDNLMATEWMRANGYKWKKYKPPRKSQNKNSSVRRRRHLRGKAEGDYGNLGKSIRQFVEGNRDHEGDDCLFVPHSVKGWAAHLSFCGKDITAARYMALLTMGCPKDENAQVKHICGNGGLSCVNPGHLVWSDAITNHMDDAD